MPRANVYIRNEDWEAWQNIEDKPGWLHDGLTKGIVTIPPKSVPLKKLVPMTEEDETHQIANPFACKKCGQMLVAGKCLTKH